MSTLREEQGKLTPQPAAPGDCSVGIIETLQFAAPLQHSVVCSCREQGAWGRLRQPVRHQEAAEDWRGEAHSAAPSPTELRGARGPCHILPEL